MTDALELRSFQSPWYLENRDWVLEWARGCRRSLELGCGTGWMTAALQAAGLEATGIDTNPVRIEQARAAFPGPRFLVGLLDQQRLPAGSFDFVLANQVLEHVDDVDDVLHQLHMVTAPGARGFFSVPNGYGLYCLIYDKVAVRFGRIGEHQTFVGLADWTAILERNAFRVVKVLRQNVLPYRLFPGGVQRRTSGAVHGLNHALCAVTPRSWAAAFFFCVERA